MHKCLAGWSVLGTPVTTAPRLLSEPGPCHPACVPHVWWFKRSALQVSALDTFPPCFHGGLSKDSSGQDVLSLRASVSMATPLPCSLVIFHLPINTHTFKAFSTQLPSDLPSHFLKLPPKKGSKEKQNRKGGVWVS